MRTTYRRTVTPGQSAQALAAVQKLFELTPAEKARARFERCKADLDEATRHLMETGSASAIERADRAMRALNSARAELAALDAEAPK